MPSPGAASGGLASAAPHPIQGGEQIACYLIDLARIAPSDVTVLQRASTASPAWSHSRTA